MVVEEFGTSLQRGTYRDGQVGLGSPKVDVGQSVSSSEMDGLQADSKGESIENANRASSGDGNNISQVTGVKWCSVCHKWSIDAVTNKRRR
jgi:hypothetical protein